MRGCQILKCAILKRAIYVAIIAGTCAVVPANAQRLRVGVTVDLPLVNYATQYPEADHEDAVIVAIAENGDIFIGADPVMLEDLALKVRRAGSPKSVYIKADANATYANVAAVLKAISADGVVEPVLLALQQNPQRLGSVVPPYGFKVALGLRVPSGSHAVRLKLRTSQSESSTLMLNEESVSWADLPNALARLLRSRDSKTVQITGSGQLTFSEVMRAIDRSRSVGAGIVLLVSGS